MNMYYSAKREPGKSQFACKRQSIDVNTDMAKMLEMSDKVFETAAVSVCQYVFMLFWLL